MSDAVDPRVAAAVEHLQRAALELVAAARNALDVIEDLARDPAPLQGIVESVLTTIAPNVSAGAGARDAAHQPRVRRVPLD